MLGHTIELRHSGARHRGMLCGSVSLSIEKLAHSFSFTYAEQLRPEEDPRWFAPGDSATLLFDGEVVVDGIIDSARVKHTPTALEFSVTGRSVAADIVDCTALTRPRQFSNATVEQITAKLVEPFGFGVRIIGGGTRPLRRFTFDKGDTAFSAVMRACKLRGLWPRYFMDDRVIELARLDATTEEVPLVVGVNVVELDYTVDFSQRFGSYHFTGSRRATNDDGETSEGENKPRFSRFLGVAKDAAISRYRPMRLQLRGGDGSGDAVTRANRERNQRAGNSEKVSAKALGWRDRDGGLWRPNQRRLVIDDELGIHGEMIITDVTFAWDARMKDGFVATV
ncbi:MAG: hypothetical protein H5U40_01495, partial [Polyangiaceae bacterium]|nr:hypothetical protein [Polyangiaceae bacterium]